jgi:hypothetical protein
MKFGRWKFYPDSYRGAFYILHLQKRRRGGKEQVCGGINKII